MKITSDFVNDRGVPFCAVRIEAGEPYGRGGWFAGLIAERPMVEFYDRRYPGHSGCELGQFVSRYYVETLAESSTAHYHGLLLDGGIHAWRVTAENMRLVRDQLYQMGV